MQYKIPQEFNVEDKIIGPFTLKGFGFIFAAAVVALVCVVSLSKHIGFIPSVLIGALLGSVFIIVGFIPFNGRPMYTFASPFINFLIKPRQRVWRREVETAKKPQTANKPAATTEAKPGNTPAKADVSSIAEKIEDIALTVDTGGAYAGSQAETAGDILEKGSPTVEQALQKAQAEASRKKQRPEPAISEMASVDPDKKFGYERPDTSKYKIDEELKKNRQ